MASLPISPTLPPYRYRGAVPTASMIVGAAVGTVWFWIPLALLIIGVSSIPSVAGFVVAALLGYVTTRKSGTTFAMITLGVGELVWSMSLMLPEFFGGEGGISGNRVVGKPLWGVSFGPQIQLYYLIAVYTFVCTGLMFAFTRTPSRTWISTQSEPGLIVSATVFSSNTALGCSACSTPTTTPSTRWRSARC